MVFLPVVYEPKVGIDGLDWDAGRFIGGRFLTKEEALSVQRWKCLNSLLELSKQMPFQERDQIIQISRYVLSLFDKPEKREVTYYPKRVTGLPRPILINPEERSFFILNKKAEVSHNGQNKNLKIAIKVSTLYDSAKVERYVLLDTWGGFDEDEVAYLKEFSGLDTQFIRYDCDKHQGTHEYILQEAGMDLEEVIDKGLASTWEAKKNILLQIAQGLTRIHAADLMHSDIKVNNIVLKDGKVAIIDYGLACPVDDTIYSKEYGCVGLTAPEIQTQTGRLADSKSQAKAEDMFALGGVAYHLLEGSSVPWAEETSKRNWPRGWKTYRECLSLLTQKLGSIQNPTQNPTQKQLYECLLALLDPNPASRLTAEQAVAKLLLA